MKTLGLAVFLIPVLSFGQHIFFNINSICFSNNSRTFASFNPYFFCSQVIASEKVINTKKLILSWKQLDDKSKEVVLREVIKKPGETATAARQLLFESEDLEIKLLCINLLKHTREVASAGELLRIAETDSNDLVRISAIQTLGSLNIPNAADLVAPFLDQQEEPNVIAAALLVMGKTGGPDDIDKVKPWLNHPDPTIKLSSGFAFTALTRSPELKEESKIGRTTPKISNPGTGDTRNKNLTLGAQFGSECLRVLEDFFDVNVGVGGGSLVQRYQNGEKHLVGFFADLPTKNKAVGIRIQLLIDLDDFLGITAEGANGWITYWVDVTLNFSLCPPGKIFGEKCLPVGVSLMTHQRAPGVDDPLRRVQFTALSANFAGLEIKVGDVGFGGSNIFTLSDAELSTSLVGGAILSTSATLLRGEIKLGELQGAIGDALSFEAGGVQWGRFAENVLLTLFLPFGLSHFGIASPPQHRAFTSLDDPFSAPSNPNSLLIARVRGGLDANSDGFADNYIPPSGSGSQPTALEKLQVFFYADHTVQEDFRIKVGEVPEGWYVVSEGASGQEVGDFYDIFNADVNGYYGTHWNIGCTPEAPEVVGIEFRLFKKNLLFPDELIDTATAAFQCGYPPPPPNSDSGYSITVVKTGGSLDGSVTSDSGDILCDPNCVRDTAIVDDGTVLTLTATPESGTVFSGWGGDCSGTGPCIVTVDAEKNITANFNPMAIVTTAPDAPENLQTTTLSTTEIRTMWTDLATDESGFKVQRRDGASGAWYHVTTVAANVTSFTHTHLLPDKTYYFRVYAFNEGGDSGFSNTPEATTLSAAPPRPNGLRAWAVSISRVGLSWVDNSNGTAGFSIEQSADGSAWSVVGYNGTDDTTFTRSVNPGSTRYYRVRAFRSGAGYSDYSNVAVVVACAPPDDPFPEAPYDGETSVSSEPILEWRGDDEVDSWDLYLGTNDPPPLFASGIPNPIPGDDIQYAPGTLNPGTTYYWRVLARAACNPAHSSSSRVYRFTTLGGPGPVTLLTPADGSIDLSTGLVLNWENVTVPGTFLYTLFFGTVNPPPEFAALGTRTEKLLTGLSPNSTYYWKVVAASADDPNLTGESPIWSFATGAGASFTVDFLAVKDAGLRSGSFGNANYGGEEGGDAEQRLFGCGNTDQLFQDPGQFPLKGAIAFDLSTIPSESTIVNATLTLQVAGTGNRPSSPSDVAIDPFSSTWAEHAITWNNRPSVNPAHSVTGVFPPSGFNPLDNNITALVQAWVDATIPNHGILFSIPSWEPVQGRYVMFYQRESTVDGANAPLLRVTYQKPCSSPGIPQLQFPGDGATDQDVTVLLDWDDVPDAGGYRVFFGDTNPPPEIEITSASDWVADGLIGSTTYYWRVEALASCNPNLVTTSPTRSFETACLPPPIPNLVSPANLAMDQPRVVSLSWNPVPGASTYAIYADGQNPPSTLRGTDSGTTFDITCTPSTRYFWIIEALAACDESLGSQSLAGIFDTAEAPIAVAGADQTVCVGQAITVGGDPSGSQGLAPYQYSWHAPDGGVLTSTITANPGFSANEAGVYRVRLVVTDARGFTSLPSEALVVCNAPPAFSGLPTSLSVCEGLPITLSVSPTGTPPFSYQWKIDGVNINGATSNSFQIPVVSEGDEGVYTCLVTNDCGSSLSPATDLEVMNPVGIQANPEDVNICPGEDFELNVLATGTPPLEYQWKKDGVDIPGAMDASLQISDATLADAGVYQCTVSNPCGQLLSDQALVVVDGALRVSLSGVGIPHGYFPVAVGFDAFCFLGNLTWYWENLETGLQFGVGDNPVDIDPIPMETTDYQLVLTDNFDGETADKPFTILVHPSGIDLNGDGQNTILDLLFAIEFWGTDNPIFDADLDGMITVQDFLYINLGTQP